VKEEAELDDEEKIKEATDSGGLLSRVQELEDELKNSEWKRMDLTQKNMALVNHLQVCQEEKDHSQQEMASVKKRLVSMLSSQVRRVEGFGPSLRVLHRYSPSTTSLSRIPFCLHQGGADKDSALIAPSEVHSKRYFALHLCYMYKHTLVNNVWLLSHYTLFGSLCTDVCFLSYTCITALCYTTLYTF